MYTLSCLQSSENDKLAKYKTTTQKIGLDTKLQVLDVCEEIKYDCFCPGNLGRLTL